MDGKVIEKWTCSYCDTTFQGWHKARAMAHLSATPGANGCDKVIPYKASTTYAVFIRWIVSDNMCIIRCPQMFKKYSTILLRRQSRRKPKLTRKLLGEQRQMRS